MTYTKFLGLGLMIAALAATGCGDKPGTTSEKTGSDKGKEVAKDGGKKGGEGHTHGGGDDHHGTGPNGGVIFDLGKYHAEFTVNHDKKECYVLVIAGDDEKAKPLPVAAKEFTLTTKETKTKEGKVVPPLTIKLLPQDAKDGKAAKFVGADPGLGNVADFAGTVGGEIAGKPSSGEFKE